MQSIQRHLRQQTMDFFKRLHSTLGALKRYYFNVRTKDLGACGEDVTLEIPVRIRHPERVFLGSHIGIRGNLKVLNDQGSLYIKDHVEIAADLTVIPYNHTLQPPIDKFQDDCHKCKIGDCIHDVTIEEDVWIGTRVTILAGVTVGRGSIIGAGGVLTKSIPPYSIAAGNPCRVIRKKFTKEQILERERILYPLELRLPIEQIERLFRP